jgi:hypothetical protein
MILILIEDQMHIDCETVRVILRECMYKVCFAQSCV